MIKIFVINSNSFPWHNKTHIDFLEKHQIYLVANESEADVIIAQRLPQLSDYRLKNLLGRDRKYLIWTEEPRWNTNFHSPTHQLFNISTIIIQLQKLNLGNNFTKISTPLVDKLINDYFSRLLPKVHIMNVYTDDVFINNYFFLAKMSFSQRFSSPIEKLNPANFSGFKNKKVAALMTYNNDPLIWSLKHKDKELDLYLLRNKIALKLYEDGCCDIYGKKWPKGVSLGNSRSGKWVSSKLEILRNYHFNLAFENTNYDYYCTEKIWDSICCQCLPIYYGKGNKIYEDFPKNSFLDYCDFKNVKELSEYIESMSEHEFITRLNLCIDVFNEACEKVKSSNWREQIMLKIVHKLQEITNQKTN